MFAFSLCNPSPTTTTTTIHSPQPHSHLFFGVLFSQKKDKLLRIGISSAVSKRRPQGYDRLYNGHPVIGWQENIEDQHIDVEPFDKVSISTEIEERVAIIKSFLESMDDGEITSSAYDTAWVALLEKKTVDDSNNSARAPQFPECLQWIADNQLPDGSWGGSKIFLAHDRILNTLACVVALKWWNVHPDKCEKDKYRMIFFKENLSKLEDENAEHMTIGFEVVFPSILEIASKLEINVPHDSPFLKEIHAHRNLKLSKIPQEILHEVPTTLLHSMEGMKELNWEKLLNLRCRNGSFLFSSACTTYAFMQTQDPNCFDYLKKNVERFNGGVPGVFPVDLFEHLWAVDRLQRLGTSRYFDEEINKCMNYVKKYWTDKGICWARDSPITDLDDTAMGFRLLRLHGHQVSADVFAHFKKGRSFETFVGQSGEAVTGMYNLYRASQLQFPGETILRDAKSYSADFLTQKRAANQIFDKWIITKDLPGEVGYALDIPWYASLPRLETRFYIEQYGGDEDVWIGKTLYRMPYVNNNIYLELAKLDYNKCQASHLSEWSSIQRWYSGSEIKEFGISKRALLFAYFVAAASIFDPERAGERLAWTKTLILVETIDSFFRPQSAASCLQRREFVREFQSIARVKNDMNIRRWIPKMDEQGPVGFLIGALNQLSLDVLEDHGDDIYSTICDVWEKWLMGFGEEGEKHRGIAELLVQTISLCGDRCSLEELLSLPSYDALSHLSNQLCLLLGHLKSQQENMSSYVGVNKINDPEVELVMQEFVHLVLQGTPDPLERSIKDIFLLVVKSFYYSALCDPGTVEFHIAKVLFEKVN